MRNAVASVALVALALAANRTGAILGPENVLVVVNSASEDSKAVAREYVNLRRIPDCNVLYLDNVPRGTVVSASDFRSGILTPVLRAIRARGLLRQIDCIAYSAGFPYAVDIGADMIGKQFPRFITQPASLTGLTYMHDLVLAADTAYLDMKANRYFRDRSWVRRDIPWSAKDRRLQADLGAAVAKVATAKSPDEAKQLIADAAALAEELAKSHPNNPELLYDFACLRALKGDADGAVRSLTRAVDAGWLNATHTETDPDLVSLRGRDNFKALIRRMRTTPIVPEPPLPFHASLRWDAARRPSGLAEGRRYMLCAMLAYTGSPANTLAEALACLRRSVGADYSRPRGTVYFAVSSDGARTGPRRWAFESAKAALGCLGVRAEVVEGVLPQGKSDVAGAVVGIATYDWSKSGSTILPGAFCDHLTSCAGVMTGGGQTLLSEWIKAGAAASSGTVTEPYALQAKFPTAFLHVYYAAGCSLAEAFYQSVSGPYQQLLVGDPLCAPWAKRVTVKVPAMKAGAVLRTRTALRPTCAGVSPVKRYELYIDGRLVTSSPPGRRLVLDPRSLTPGPHEARVVAVAGPLEWRGRAVVPLRVAR